MKLKTRQRLLTILKTVIFITLIVFGYPRAYGMIRRDAPTILPYTPSTGLLENLPVQDGPPAKAVPILLYHGVVDKPDNENTTRAMFIRQMETLKKAGYTTITLAQLEKFYRGEFVLPPKPIMITFDDGRKDSYYPTDEIFRQLGYTAVLFEATGQIFKKDNFYLTWDELATVRDNPRWEIGAHGRFSHEHIIIDAQGTVGRFLTSRIYDPATGLESIDAYKKRVEQDYVNGINDLRDHLGITTAAYAVPLNDYGEVHVSNYPDASAFNHEMINKYFHTAFIEPLTYDPLQLADYSDPKMHWNLYNYQNDDPLSTARTEPREMNPDLLLSLLERSAPKNPNLSLDGNDPTLFRNATDVQYADVNADAFGLNIRPAETSTAALVTIGDTHWQNYSVDTVVDRQAGRSLAVQVYAKSRNELITIGLSDNGVYLHEIHGDSETELMPAQLLGIQNNHQYNLSIKIKNQLLTVTIDNQIIFRDVKISIDQGAVSFKIWDPVAEKASAMIKSLHIQSLN